MGLYIPDEILQHIMRYFLSKEPRRLSSLKYPYDDVGFDPSLRPTDLHSLCLVSRRFCDIAQPLLYHTINVTYETIDATVKGHQREWPGCLLRTMAENPHLAKQIRVLAIQSYTPGAVWSTDFPWDVPQSLRCVLKDAIQRPDPHAVSLAILFYATMVERIILSSNDPDGLHIFWVISSWLPYGNPSYDCAEISSNLTPELGPFANHGHPRLKEICLDGFYDDCHPLDRVFVDIMKKPGLFTLCTNGGWWSPNFFNPPKLPAGVLSDDWPSSLKVLKLENCVLDGYGFAYILQNCPRLNILKINLAKSKWIRQDGFSWTLDLDQIGQTLRDHGSNLTHLSFHTFNFKLSLEPIGRIGSLCAMTSLRHLRFSRNDLIVSQEWVELQKQSILSLESILPSSIITVRISYEEASTARSPPSSLVFTEIESLLASERLRSLERVEVIRYIHDSPDELVLFRTEIPHWSVGSRRKPSKSQDGVDEYMSITRFRGSKSDSFNNFGGSRSES
ncbi:unnamed protein product [Clonostachys chloroleuca]|uniref:F-box domain-containing protein n=1 Tax=Clonostachys chloroleuca TaxID=1926264 RepID=A0AA35LPP6_9HYPO|nr:unnamed protein product [Clonostachys chloroleuca]